MIRLRSLTCCLALCTAIQAEPAWRNELTPIVGGEKSQLGPITPSVMDFNVSWKGWLDAGKLRIEFAPKDADKPGMLVVRSNAASHGPASGLFPYRSHFWSEIHPDTLRPRFFHAVEIDRREKISTTLRFASDHVKFEESSRSLKSGKSTQTAREFHFQPVFDLYSAMLFVRQQRLDPGDRIALVVHPFKTPYLVRVRVIARERHMERPAIRLSVSMQKIDAKTMKLKAYKKLHRDATLWLSDDGFRIPLELRAAVFIGDVRATLSGFRRL